MTRGPRPARPPDTDVALHPVFAMATLGLLLLALSGTSELLSIVSWTAFVAVIVVWIGYNNRRHSGQ